MNYPHNSQLNLTQQVADKLGSDIVAGVYNNDSPVPSEAVLCKQFDVSRSAAREAVKSLAAKGLISSRARQGIRILPESEWNLFDADVLRWIRKSNPSLELLKEFTELRLAVEPEAAWLAAENQDVEKISLIGAALNQMKQADLGFEDALEADINFHISILNASKNRFFMQLGRIIDTTLRVSIRFTNTRTGARGGSYPDHKKIYDAIVSNNPELANQAATDLLTASLNTIKKAIKD